MKQFDQIQDESLDMMDQTMSILAGGNDESTY